MDGVHDCGGLHGFDPLDRQDGVALHEAWERRAVGLHMSAAGAGIFNLDEMRRSIEQMPANEYLEASYFERWLFSLETLLVEKGVATREEIRKARIAAPPHLTPRPDSLGPTVDFESGSFRINNSTAVARYKVGDRVMLTRIAVAHHTRLPRYARGAIGEIVAARGVFGLPDSRAHGGPDNPEHVYTVLIRARDVWAHANSLDTQCVDVWERYIEGLSGGAQNDV